MKICGTCNNKKPLSNFSKKYNKYQSQCKKCAKEYGKQWYQQNSEQQIMKATERRNIIGKHIKEIKIQSKCSSCDEDDWRCLDFHHKDPEKKSFSISSATRKGASMKLLTTEIEKCIIICANCHRKEHFI